MDNLFAWMEGTALAAWTRESPSLWAYPTVITLHSVGLAIVVGGCVAIDFRLLGWARTIPMAALTPLFRIITWAFVLNAASGFLLFIADATTKATQPVFLVKLAFILLALVATVAVARRMRQAPDRVDGPLLPIASLLLWIGAIAAGRLMAYL